MSSVDQFIVESRSLDFKWQEQPTRSLVYRTNAIFDDALGIVNTAVANNETFVSGTFRDLKRNRAELAEMQAGIINERNASPPRFIEGPTAWGRYKSERRENAKLWRERAKTMFHEVMVSAHKSRAVDVYKKTPGGKYISHDLSHTRSNDQLERNLGDRYWERSVDTVTLEGEADYPAPHSEKVRVMSAETCLRQMGMQRDVVLSSNVDARVVGPAPVPMHDIDVHVLSGRDKPLPALPTTLRTRPTSCNSERCE